MVKPREWWADVLGGAFWIVFGIAVVASGLLMDVPRHLGATFLSGPGFVPILLGGALIILGLVLVLRSLGGEVIAFFAEANGATGAVSDRRALLALALMLVYALGMVGRMPFEYATFLFITAFIVLFTLPFQSFGRAARGVGAAALTALLTTAAVVVVFREVFLVRLP